MLNFSLKTYGILLLATFPEAFSASCNLVHPEKIARGEEICVTIQCEAPTEPVFWNLGGGQESITSNAKRCSTFSQTGNHMCRIQPNKLNPYGL